MPQSFDPSIIREIATMGHEIGYHYETMDTADGDPELALEHFEDGLNRLRSIAEIRTICMHGSPLSRYDNRDLWKRYSYRDYGIIGEPYFDLDFSRVLYLTDTGRRWDGDKVSVRDRGSVGDLKSMASDPASESAGQGQGSNVANSTEAGQVSEGQQPLAAMYRFRSTADLIQASRNNQLPSQMMINFHPQRWTDDSILWIREWLMQNAKNVLKRGLIWVRG